MPTITSRTLRDRSLLKPPTRYGFHHYYEPNTFESAIRCTNAKYWKEAIEKEINSIENQEVWESYAEEPPNPLNTTWVFKIKDNTHAGYTQSVSLNQAVIPACIFAMTTFPEYSSIFSNSSCHKPNTILGMKYERENNKIKLSLPKHIEHGLEELGLTDCKISVTPLTPNLKLREATDEDHARFKKLNINYRSAIGLLNHIAQLTRPDISFAVSSLARYSVKPGMTHWHEQCFLDDPLDRTSQSGHFCFLFGTIISWNSSKQRCITYLSTEAELNPLVDAFHEGIWLKALLAEVWNIQLNAATHLIDDPDLCKRLMMSEKDFKIKFTNEHLIDNKGLDDKVKKFGSNPKTRHIDLKTKGIRQEVKHRNIRISLIKTSDMIANALTKAAARSSITVLTQAIDADFKFNTTGSHQSLGVLE
ncbi:hypothetical protein VP01_199g1 [Puccinia sorghi]|uniref:Reverse transcriptase Ty1/copia-type domain-containing protein n=1 Tax=Puccinia sorghi TaxID=27349 RepID=A0A0L6VBK0_9BASI|nr:hypothetical protein VP01_199g1 [Puccinia sorghi]